MMRTTDVQGAGEGKGEEGRGVEEAKERDVQLFQEANDAIDNWSS